MKTEVQASLASPSGDAITQPLQATHIDVRIDDLIASVTLEHRFRNGGSDPIEALLTFPMPPDAAFLGMQAEIGGKVHRAEVIAARAAESKYDEAIADGNSAILVRTPEPGILTVSLGNLMPGESATIQLRFASRVPVAGAGAWFRLPTVLRPRYGNWALDDFETPEHDFATEHPLTAVIHVSGLLSRASISCPSHAIGFEATEDATRISIPSGYLDRDVLLRFELKQAPPPVLRLLRHGDQVLASITGPVPLGTTHDSPMDLCLVLDCSGSMRGDAIMQSRAAVRAIGQLLTDKDRIQIIRFGSSAHAMFRRLMPCKPVVRNALGELAESLEADLGGTEMQEALMQAREDLQTSGEDRSKAMILVTDGAVQPHHLEVAQRTLVEEGIRVFIVAVGSSAGVEVLEPLAHATGARIERAILGEPIDAAAERMARRARSPHPEEVVVSWPGGSAVVLRGAPVYPGDSISVSVVADALPAGQVTVRVGAISHSLSPTDIEESDALRAIIGEARYAAASEATRPAIALAHRLLTKDTSAVLVRELAASERAQSLPEVVKVPSMVPAGMVSLRSPMGSIDRAFAPRSIPAPYPASGGLSDIDACENYFDAPAFLRRERVAKEFTGGQDLINALVPALREMLPSLATGGLTLASLVDRLPSETATRTREYFTFLGIKLDDPGTLVGFMFAVFAVTVTELTDEEELDLSLAAAKFGNPVVKLAGL